MWGLKTEEWCDSNECDSKKSKFIKEQEATGLLSSLGIKTPLNKIPLLGPLFFYEYSTSKYKL